MLVAIIAAIATLVIIVVIAFLVLFFMNRRQGAFAKSKDKDVTNIDSVGVSSSYQEKHDVQKTAQRSATPEARANPQDGLGSRFIAMGVLATAIFGSLAARLWSMQVLASDDYEKQAAENRTATVYTPAPRGYICDASGMALVENKTSLTVLADAEVAENHDVVQRLSTVLGIPFNIVRQRIQDASSGAQSQRVVASNVSRRNIAFISEHPDAFPGVVTQTRTVRRYPYGALAAHVLGYTGSINQDEYDNPPEGLRYQLGDEVGKSGIEASYEQVLAGTHGERTVIADANGAVREILSEESAKKGNDIRLTIEAPVQYEVDKLLAETVTPADGTRGKGTAASAVVLDAKTGAVIAMSNYPTYEPESLIGSISTEDWDKYQEEKARVPLLNRAIAGQYPSASTYKAFTGLAGLKYGFGGGSWTCSGAWSGFHESYTQHCWNRSGHGTLDLRGGIVNSCDVVFYEIAKSFYYADDLDPNAMQDCIKEFGFGKLTGIDIGGEYEGVVPTPESKAEMFPNAPEEGMWQPGDMSNTAIGQGLVHATPLQIAAGYGGVATGKVMRPHLLKEVRNSYDEVVVTAEPEVLYEPDFSEQHFATMRDALRGVATESSKVRELFEKNNVSNAAAKTGTAEVASKEDFAWFACYAPHDDPKYVVACVVEEGGGGADTAAPIGAKILSTVLKHDAGELKTKVEKLESSIGKTIYDVVPSSSGRQD